MASSNFTTVPGIGFPKIENNGPGTSILSSNYNTLPVTTTIDSLSLASSVVNDVDLYSFMRAIPVDFTSYNLRPNRKVYPFFDNKDISNFVEKPNKIVLDTRAHYQSMITGAIANVHYTGNSVTSSIDTKREEIFIKNQKASVLFSEVDETGNTILYTTHLTSRTIFEPAAYNAPYNKTFTQDVLSFETLTSDIGNFQVSSPIYAADGLAEGSVVGVKSGQTANIVSYEHHSGIARIVTVADLNLLYTNTSSNNEFSIPNEVSPSVIKYGTVDISRVRLSDDASPIDNWYSGNTISFVKGYQPGAIANIVSYNGATRIAEISIPVVENIEGWQGIVPNSNTIYSIGDSKSPYVSSNTRLSHYTTQSGFLAGTFHIPDPKNTNSMRFRVGDRILSITDTPTNDVDDCTTVAEYRFTAAGLAVVSRQIASNTKSVLLSPTPASSILNPTPEAQPKNLAPNRSPLAQSFYISPSEYQQGMFIPYIDVFFANKGTLPVTMQIRPLTNGTPDSNVILPNAISIVQAEDVKVSTNPNADDVNTYTRFTFPSPVYVAPDRDYAFLILTNDFDYDVYVSELGEKIIGTERIVSEQPYLGSLFKSQNATTYSAIQSEDIMFVIHKCNFFGSGSIVLSEEKDLTVGAPYFNRYYDSNVAFDAFEVHSDSIELPGTQLVFSYKSVNNSTDVLDNSYTEFKPDKRTFLPERKKLYGRDILNDSFLMKVDLVTTSADVSPVISLEKQNIGTIATIINNMSIDPYKISIKDSGNNYTSQNTTVTFTSNTSGVGAQAVPITQIERVYTGKIAGLAFDSNGFGYFDDVQAVITTSDANVSNAVISVDTETGKAGGPAAARYISKTVTLAPEFNAGDLRVYLTAIKPPESNVQVYYKVHNRYDNEPISEKNWVRMTQRIGEVNFSSALNPIELEFRPSMNANNIIYSTNTATFDTFSQFKIKIVMSSSDTVWSKIPFVYDMRAIALPADTE